MKTLYDVLGVGDTDTTDTLKAAYKHLVLEHHPDWHFGDKVREETLKQVQAAYDGLRDPEKRAAYDAQLRADRAAAAMAAAEARARQERDIAVARARARAMWAGGAIAVSAAGIGLGLLLVSKFNGDRGSRDPSTGRYRGEDGRFRAG